MSKTKKGQLDLELGDQEEEPDAPRRPYRPRRSDPATSRAWARRKNVTYGKNWAAIERVLAGRREGGTYSEVAQWTGIPGTSTSTDMNKMEEAGILERRYDSEGSLVRRNGCMIRWWVPIERRRHV